MNFAEYTEIVAVNLCVCTPVRKRWERAFGIRSNCICPRMDYIENIVRCVKITGNLWLPNCGKGNFQQSFRAPCRVVDKLRK